MECGSEGIKETQGHFGKVSGLRTGNMNEHVSIFTPWNSFPMCVKQIGTGFKANVQQHWRQQVSAGLRQIKIDGKFSEVLLLILHV